MMTKTDYLDWEKRLGFDRHGGRSLAAKALGVSPETIRRLRTGDGDYGSRTLALAMTAVALDLPPWPVAIGGERD